MSLWSNLGTLAGYAGNLLHLPEYGVSESMGSNWQPYTYTGVTQPYNNSYSRNNYTNPIPNRTTTNQTNQNGNILGVMDNNPAVNIPGGFDQGWNDWNADMDAIMANLGQSKSSQESSVLSQYNQGVGDVNLQQTQGLQDLAATTRQTDTSQAKNLSDLSGNIRNQMMAGQNMLGARGAGDSSAANQYAYALTKMGTQARGNLLGQYAEIRNQIADRITTLKNTVNNKLNDLVSVRDQALSGIAQWFSEAQTQVYQAKGQGAQAKAQQVLSYAMQMAQQTNATFQANQQALQQWALNNSQNIKELASNISAIQSLPINGAPTIGGQQANNYQPGGYYGNATQKKDINGNPIA